VEGAGGGHKKLKKLKHWAEKKKKKEKCEQAKGQFMTWRAIAKQKVWGCPAKKKVNWWAWFSGNTNEAWDVSSGNIFADQGKNGSRD